VLPTRDVSYGIIHCIGEITSLSEVARLVDDSINFKDIINMIRKRFKCPQKCFEKNVCPKDIASNIYFAHAVGLNRMPAIIFTRVYWNVVKQ
jgi:hypothetical protein